MKDNVRRLFDPFDAMRANRVLAHDPNINDIRWLIGESLRRCYRRARVSEFVTMDRTASLADDALSARDKINKAALAAGPHAWPIVTRIIIEGAGVRECRALVTEIATPWRADAIIVDRLRCALDILGPLLGVTK